MKERVYVSTMLNIVLWISISLLISGCSTKSPQNQAPKEISVTKLPKGEAKLLEHLKKTDKVLADKSAFYPLPQPTDAFAARLFLIDNATTSLNVQYYIYEDDHVGKVFAAHLLMAAQRGVKVRILIDDLITTDKDEEWENFSLHPNVELRLFNPNSLRTSMRNLALLMDVNRLGRRMHNKALVADGSAAIIGGRNIGDVYFAFSKETLFIDYDVLTIGSVVSEINKEFDLYWNSEESIPSKDVFAYDSPELSISAKQDLLNTLQAFNKSPVGNAIQNSEFNQKIAHNDLQLTVAKRTDFYYDHPSKVSTSEDDNRTHISSQISEDLKHINEDLLIISPYFIPSDRMMARFKILREKGVEVTVITNSLASTDVTPVYGGYKGYIKSLVEMGVNLYEVKPHSFKKFLRSKKWVSKQALSLHTKMMILDGNRLGVGSANMDPRSDKLNTEIFMVISSNTLAKAQWERLNEIITLENFYQLSWGEYPKRFDEDMTRFGPIWKTKEEGQMKIYYAPPHTGFWKKVGADISSALPIKGYL